MSTINPNQWFTEIAADTGSAISLKITRQLDEVQSPFQKVTVFETEEFGNLMIIDGCTMVSTRENFIYHEMMSHPAIFSHPNPKNVVIIGGGDCGTLREVLKHPGVETAHQIEIDEVVTRMAEKYFPELCESNDDPRATILFDDGIKFMADALPDSIDIIIVDSTDPIGPGEGLFNRAFYQSCLKALRSDGILVQQSESPLLHLPLMKDMRDAMKDSGFNSLQTLTFPQMIYPSGWWSCTMAKKTGDFEQIRTNAFNESELNTLYYTPTIHEGAMALPPFVKSAL